MLTRPRPRLKALRAESTLDLIIQQLSWGGVGIKFQWVLRINLNLFLCETEHLLRWFKLKHFHTENCFGDPINKFSADFITLFY